MNRRSRLKIRKRQVGDRRRLAAYSTLQDAFARVNADHHERPDDYRAQMLLMDAMAYVRRHDLGLS